MYYLHNLRSNLQEWKNRLYRTEATELGIQLKFFLNKIENEKAISAILMQIVDKYKMTDEEIEERMDSHEEFENEEEQTAIYFQLLKFFRDNDRYKNIYSYLGFPGGNSNDPKGVILDKYLAPIVNYLHDRLDQSSSTLYLLEKYKRRTEWFTKDSLRGKYSAATKNYEQIFEDDLRLFLFDQGIEFPFSTPQSPSGRADIVGAIDTNNPLVVEIKIFDLDKNYGKDRIKRGFSQIVKYTNDYNKDFGYLVIFNLSAKELRFNLPDNDNRTFPPKFPYGNRVFYFIVVNLQPHVQASKIGKTEFVEISESDLVV